MPMAGCSGAPPTPAISRPAPVTAHSLDAYPASLPAPMGVTGPDLLADHVALAKLYHALRTEAETWVAWMLAPPPGVSPRTGGGGDR